MSLVRKNPNRSRAKFPIKKVVRPLSFVLHHSLLWLMSDAANVGVAYHWVCQVTPWCIAWIRPQFNWFRVPRKLKVTLSSALAQASKENVGIMLVLQPQELISAHPYIQWVRQMEKASVVSNISLQIQLQFPFGGACVYTCCPVDRFQIWLGNALILKYFMPKSMDCRLKSACNS